MVSFMHQTKICSHKISLIQDGQVVQKSSYYHTYGIGMVQKYLDILWVPVKCVFELSNFLFVQTQHLPSSHPPLKKMRCQTQVAGCTRGPHVLPQHKEGSPVPQWNEYLWSRRCLEKPRARLEDQRPGSRAAAGRLPHGAGAAGWDPEMPGQLQLPWPLPGTIQPHQAQAEPGGPGAFSLRPVDIILSPLCLRGLR